MAVLMELVLAEGLWCLRVSWHYLSEWTAIMQPISVCVCICLFLLCFRSEVDDENSNKKQVWVIQYTVYVDSIFLPSICHTTEKTSFEKAKLWALSTHSNRRTHIHTQTHSGTLRPARSEREISLRSVTIFLTMLPENEAFTATISASLLYLHLCTYTCSVWKVIRG